MSIESIIFVALFIQGGGSAGGLKPPKAAGPKGGTSNKGGGMKGLAKKAGGAAQKAGSAYQRAKLGAMKGGMQGALKGGAKGLATGGPMGALAGATKGGIGGALKGGLNGLKGGGKDDPSKIPTQDLRASKEGQRGFLPEPKIPGLKKAQKQIPKEDLRKQPMQQATAVKRGIDKVNDKMEQVGKKVAAQYLSKQFSGGAIPPALLEKLIGLGLKVEKIRRRVMLLAILAGVGLIFALLTGDGGLDAPKQSTPGTPTTSDTCNPAVFPATQDPFGQTSVCTITVTYAGSAQDISISDSIMPGTKFVSATSNGMPDASQTLVTWDAKQDGLALNPVNITVSVVLQVTTHQKNLKIYNPYAISPTGLSGASNNGSTTIPGNLPPSTDNCSGIYSYYMGITPGHQNYGDPTCTLIKKDPNGTAIINKDAILSELKTLKPSEAMGWFICVVPNESGYNANAYLGASTSGYGAYGLVQMNPTGKGNGQYDLGEVVWPLQLSNGINYNDKVIGHTFSYWPKSYDSCLNNYGVTVN